MTCVVCGREAVHNHHCIYAQELRRVARSAKTPWSVLVADKRNLIQLCLRCHQMHHSRARPIDLRLLPNEVIAFTRQILGVGPGYEYLIRHYTGDDARVSALLAEWEAKAA